MGRVIEIANNLAILSLYRGFMQIKIDKISTSQIALSDIDILILNGTGATISTNLLNELLENGTMVLVLGKNYAPSGIFYPTNPHYLHKQRINLQINATKPLNKRLWQTIIKAKITNQAKILSFFTKEQEQQLLLCGLTPAIGIHHSNQENAFCLVDDLMEPYRPIVDFMVKKITEKEPEIKELTTDHKKMLSKILQTEIIINNEKTSLANSIPFI
jgi:CRISPR/Cas system-associated endonuclease Cas1